VLDAIVNLFTCPHATVFQLFKNIDLLDPLGRVDLPSAPVSVIIEIILSGTGLKNSITGYGPGKLVFEGVHYLNSKKRVRKNNS
jgi:hypothetical protein